MHSTNEWSQLKKVLVGTASGAKIPEFDVSLRTINYADKTDSSSIPPAGAYPQWILDEANEDLEQFCDVLKQAHVEVVRPENTNPAYYNYCPRDTALIYGDTAYAAPMPVQARRNEYYAYAHHLTNIVDLQQPYIEQLYNTQCIGNPDILALTNVAPAFDAANVLRANEDLLYLVSNSGNQAGAELLQQHVDARVHLLEGVYSYMHIDSTLAFLREGLLLANPSRIKNANMLPAPFNTWDIIWCADPVDIGHAPGYCNASVWVGMNLFSINETTVVVEQSQTALARQLEQHGVDVALLPCRHQRTLGGGWHCVTLDLIRG